LDALQKNENVTISPGTLEALLQKKWIRIHSNRVSLAGDGWIMMDSAVQALIPHNIPS
jgi:hypothetical protein